MGGVSERRLTRQGRLRAARAATLRSAADLARETGTCKALESSAARGLRACVGERRRPARGTHTIHPCRARTLKPGLDGRHFDRQGERRPVHGNQGRGRGGRRRLARFDAGSCAQARCSGGERCMWMRSSGGRCGERCTSETGQHGPATVNSPRWFRSGFAQHAVGPLRHLAHNSSSCTKQRL